MKEVLLFGDGGHAKVVRDVLHQTKEYVVTAIADTKYTTKKRVNHILQMSIQEAYDIHADYTCFIAIGDNVIREIIATELEARNAQILTILAPSAIISPTARIEKGAFIGHGAIIQADARIGKHVIINTGSVIEHECEIKRYAQIGPGAICTGNVQIEKSAFIGAGAVIIPGKIVNQFSVIGAGSTVIHDTKSYTVAVGTPATVIKKTR
ncbi:acetyltransferase [Bacillus wiedmannii]|uniref:acetyltransferase n=1 Tax=Bacillus wiedmannii TaxID=1890302 RepID=UPI000BF13BEF|nr:acetyltransferase [Bacillus wiedmannii]PEO38850.1 acetyltransferase [Bacillus wiedmannii]